MTEDNDLLPERARCPGASTVAAQVLPGALDGDLDPQLLPGPALWLPRDTLADWAVDPGEPPRWRGFRLVTDLRHWELVGPTDPGSRSRSPVPTPPPWSGPHPAGAPANEAYAVWR